jgi:hypothetical protein
VSGKFVLERKGAAKQGERGLIVCGRVLQGTVCVGEVLLVEWSKAHKVRAAVVAVEARDATSGAWSDAAVGTAGCEVRVTLGDIGGSGGSGGSSGSSGSSGSTAHRGKQAVLARFVYKDGREGGAVTHGQTFTARCVHSISRPSLQGAYTLFIDLHCKVRVLYS